MRRRKTAAVLIALVCAAMFLIGTLLILHTEHECHQMECPVCMALERRADLGLCLVAMLTVGGLSCSMYKCSWSLSENQFIFDWTPVGRKVKLLN